MKLFDYLPVKMAQKKKCIACYKAEIIKQTNPYQQWLIENETKEASALVKTGLIPVVYYDSILDIDFSSIDSEYTALIHKSGVLSPNALCEISDEMHRNDSTFDLIYADEDVLSVKENGVIWDETEKERRSAHFFKPDWSPDTFLSLQYLGNFVVVRTELAKQAQMACFDENADIKNMEFAVQYYDFLLRLTEKITDFGRIRHISKVLYHKLEQTGKPVPETSIENKAQAAKIQKNAIERRGYTGAMLYSKLVKAYNPVYSIKKEAQGRVSVIIPSKDNFSVLKACIDSIIEKTVYSNYEIIVVDNGSKEETAERIRAYAKEKEVSYLYEHMDFDFPRMCNIGVKQANGEYLLFMNDDITVCDAERKELDYMTVMAGHASLPYVGAVGAKLYYPGQNIIQHVGITNLRSGGAHKLVTYPDEGDYYFGRNRYAYNVIAVTGACLMVSKEKYLEVGGFNVNIKIGYNDVALGASLVAAGYYNVIRNDVILYHHESLSRGEDKENTDKYIRLLQEREDFYKSHEWLRGTDPFYNKNLTQDDITYVPNTTQAHADRYLYNSCIWSGKLPKSAFVQSKNPVQAAVDSVTKMNKMELNEQPFYQVEGWMLVRKYNNAYFDRYLTLTDNQGTMHIYAVNPKCRKDVGAVFPDETNTVLAGFNCKIRRTELEQSEQYQIGLLVKHKFIQKHFFYATEQRLTVE